ncbi:MAG: branched-chain amino acid ABC transporter permease [bacterium]
MNQLLKKIWVWILAALIIAVLPWMFPSGFALSLLGQMGLAIIFALAYNMLLGQGGMLSFGHAIYFGLSGYFTIHFLNVLVESENAVFPVSLLPLVGGFVAMFFGILIGYVSTRRAGTTFAMISLGFGEMATAMTLILIAVFNGEEGIQGDRVTGLETLLGIDYGSNIQVYYLTGVWCMIAMIAMYLITQTPFGRMSNAVRDNPERVQFVGYNTQRVRWLAFTLSAFFSGVAGALHALNFEHVGFETVGLAKSGLVLFMVFIGGARIYYGPILGAILITFLEGNLSGITDAWVFYLGVFFIVMVMFAPTGLAGLVALHEPVWRVDIKLLRRMVRPYAAVLGAVLMTCIGVIGLIEMIFFLSHNLTGETSMVLYFLEIRPQSVLPWLSYGVLGAIGVGLCWKVFPYVGRNWNQVMEQVKQRMAA